MSKDELKRRFVTAVYDLEDAAENWKETMLDAFSDQQSRDTVDDDLKYTRNTLFELFAEAAGIDMSDELDYDYHEDEEEED